MDRIDAMKVFVAALDAGSLSAAGRRLGRSPAAVSRAIAFLEHHVGTELLHRTTRALKLSEAGERYAFACRRILGELEEADLNAAGERAAPRGTLTLSAPPISGEQILQPIVDAYLDAFPGVSVNLVLLDRPVNLVEEGIDVALRVGELPDSSLVALRVGGDVKRVVVAAPRYLAAHPRIDEPADLLKHRIVTTTHFGHDSWIFPPLAGSAVPRTVHFKPRLVVNSVRAALASAVAGHGVTRLYAYHVAERVRDGSLQILLREAEAAAMPVHLIVPQGRLSVPKVRAFVDFAAPRLRAEFARLSADAGAVGA
ncbi:LysR family transcriptional regulator [Variovorax sp. UMC13]|uniref:LysR family transcriptional regulator n=1 Tax=Variovorax sp. UMC13 TaxID=1862326 RepID=UPI001603C00B|nr:LysR family transcriptional regulator [Variovorax sp. UMC13]MBB1603523.1 LysR family transcriptional regulator [Variovorax sp. UMC13]